jgi:hypothetical protein
MCSAVVAASRRASNKRMARRGGAQVRKNIEQALRTCRVLRDASHKKKRNSK